MIRLLKTFCLTLVFATSALAEGEKSGEFDYYVLSLSWTPSWCELEGDARNSPQCDTGKGFGFTLHGLWPQYEQGWPSYCETDAVDPSRKEIEAMADIMGSSGLAWHEWKKHGRCSGLTAEGYYNVSRTAYENIKRPEILRQIMTPLNLHPKVIENAFLAVNPSLSPDGIAVTCKANRIQETRICLSKELEPRMCGRDVIRDCKENSILPPVR